METVDNVYSYRNDGANRGRETSLLLSRHGTSEQNGARTSNGNVNLITKTRNNKIPAVVWMAMKIACVFYHRNITGERLCFRCKIRESQENAKLTGKMGDLMEYMSSNYVDPISQWYELPDVKHSGFGDHQALFEMHNNKQKSCKYCEIYWWNYDGEVEKYNDNKIGVKFWNHPGSWFLSLFVVAGALVLLFYFTFYDVVSWWGKENELLHIIAYGVFMMNLISWPALSLCSKIVSRFRGSKPSLSWATAINARYILKRLQFIGFCRDGIPGKLLLLLCNLLPFIIASYRSFMYIIVFKTLNKRSVTSVLLGGIVMWMWGNFQYLLYLIRLSFQRQFRLVTQFVESHNDDLESCLLLIGNAVQDFNCYRKFIVIYMSLFISINTWAITTQVTWQYLLLKNTDVDQLTCYIPQSIKYLNILYWSNVSFFIILGFWSVGGFGVTNMFEEFRVNIVALKRQSTYKVWKKLVEHVDDVSSVPRGGITKSTMILSVINFFIALKIGQDQTVSDFTITSICNSPEIITQTPV